MIAEVHPSERTERDDSTTAVESVSGETQHQTWPRRWLFRLVAVGLGLLAAFVIAEIGLRLLVDQEAKRMATYDETLGWRGRPGGHGVYIRSADNIRVAFQYNNLGFRDEDVAAKPNGCKRVMLLGDSFVESLEVDYADTFPSLVEQKFIDRGNRSEVVVIGSQGYSTSQQLLAFRKYQATVAADVVLLCFYCGNDFEDNLRRRFAYLDDSGALQIPVNRDPAWKHKLRWLQRWLYESSHVVFTAKNGVQSLTDIKIAPAAKTIQQADLDYQHKLTAELLSQLDQEVDQAGAQFGLVLIPFRDDLVSGQDDGQQFLLQFCADKKIPCIDLAPMLSADHFFKTDIHFNRDGQRVVADAIDGFLTQSFDWQSAAPRTAAAQPTSRIANR